ncbi:helix-turn-helix domain-containing protein [Coraliomargarita sp. SDUM461004]|uniref:Helix-turn-helix domain-containing protein n=1 Tax=Thalassobacterium sedimentorum TaxID=3041258 RepID=A0ABU1AND0_9BACT|nr:helix-turn-helix domain-containing protein [Coraliomargarita sp. SDUM461004]MDQ8196303.1 helix-turn-helix domain-containing protein [Coraliomargarita sp. SDUM461004]
MDTELFNELKDSIRQMKAIEAGELAPTKVRIVNPENEVASARIQLGLTQEAFAKLLDTPVGTVRGWEQGRRQPPPSAKVLMRVATKYPEQVLECAEAAAEYNQK